MKDEGLVYTILMWLGLSDTPMLLQVLELEGSQELVALSPHLLPSAERQGATSSRVFALCFGRLCLCWRFLRGIGVPKLFVCAKCLTEAS